MARIFKIPTGWVFQTEAIEVKLTENEAKELMNSVLGLVMINDRITDQTAEWLGTRNHG